MTDERVVVGVQPVREALRVHGKSLTVLIARDGGPRLQALGRFAADCGATLEEVDTSRIDKLSRGVHHQGVLALAPPLVVRDAALIEVTPALLLVALDGITDPQNFGAVIRSAVALGATGVLWGEHHAAPLTPATFRASAGAVEHAALYRAANMRSAIAGLQSRGATVIALDASAEVSLADMELGGPCALVIGSEDKGVGRGIRKVCSASARLPMPGPVASLNASVASAIAVYEVMRQRV